MIINRKVFLFLLLGLGSQFVAKHSFGQQLIRFKTEVSIANKEVLAFNRLNQTWDSIKSSNPKLELDSVVLKTRTIVPFENEPVAINLDSVGVLTTCYLWQGKPDIDLDNLIYINPGEALLKDSIDIGYPNFYKTIAHGLISPNLNQERPSADLINIEIPDDEYRPYFISKHEVTNNQYRQFVNYVKDSIARRLLSKEFPAAFIKNYDSLKSLAQQHLDWSYSFSYWDNRYMPLLVSIYYPEKRFYRRKERDPRLLIYQQITNTDTSYINVYPDTSKWLFNGEEYNPMATMYYWHPAYDNYPVVNVSYHQAKSYCHWMEKKVNSKLKKESKLHRLKYDLPTEQEWLRAALINRKSTLNLIYQNTYSPWKTDLIVDRNLLYPVEKWILTDQYRYVSNENDSTRKAYGIAIDSTSRGTNPFLLDRIGKDYHSHFIKHYYPFHADPIAKIQSDKWLKKLKKGGYDRRMIKDFEQPKRSQKSIHAGKDHVYYIKEFYALNCPDQAVWFLGGNVSEWLNSDYHQFKPYYQVHQNQMELKQELSGYFIEKKNQDYYFRLCDENGQMVRGANWLDFRLSNYKGENLKGMDAKTFLAPNKSLPTVGFRCVARVYGIEETLPE
ncbi:MAG: SUMF1/EgtB/PvdO family nonheme iron enzyme [Flavobacteriales bacterium]|nr:SUMF1/EgtB/PvdO family nonheme iron enzyme [Flavobacteriales bacterium]